MNISINMRNIIIVGATGSGKSYIACALGVEACNATMKVMYVRLPDLLAELDLAKVQGNYRKRINQYIKCVLLILDEWLLIGTNNAEQQDILEILEKRYRIHSTVFCSQFDVAGWHSKLGGQVHRNGWKLSLVVNIRIITKKCIVIANRRKEHEVFYNRRWWPAWSRCDE